MKTVSKKTFNVVLYGMNKRTIKSMSLYFESACDGSIVIVDDINAEAYIIDLDSNNGKKFFEKIQQLKNIRPIISLSNKKLKLNNIIEVEKPIRRKDFLNAIKEAEKIIKQSNCSTVNTIEKNSQEFIKNNQKKSTAIQMNESNLYNYLGLIEDIGINDMQQISQAYYNPKNYFQGYVASVFKVANTKMQATQLKSNWHSLFVFPRTHEIWLDADDSQLKAFATLEMCKASGSKLITSRISYKNFGFDNNLNNFQDMNAFMWKLAIWTSKGRYPKTIELERPIYIKAWPNFTRLLLTPHALQITALLIQEPKKILDIAKILQIKLQYVFIFVSAALALDLIGQNLNVLPNKSKLIKKKNMPVEKKPPKGLLSRFMQKLRTFI